MKAKLTQKTVDTLKPGAKRFDAFDSEMSGFLVRTETSGSRTYYIKYRREDGKRVMLKVGDAAILTLVQARDHARRLLADALRGEDPAEARKEARRHIATLADLLTEYETVNAGKPSLAEEMRAIRANFGELMDKPLDSIKLFSVEKVRARLNKEGKPRAGSRYCRYLKTVLNFAVAREFITENPLAKFKAKEMDPHRVRYLTPQEEAALFEAIDKRETRLREARESHREWCEKRNYPAPVSLDGSYADYVKPMIEIVLNTGVRRRELMTLTWESVDFEAATLTIEARLAKTRTVRRIPLNARAMAAFKGWQACTGLTTGLVFEGPDGEAMHDINSAWETLLADAGIKGFTFHDMRHTFASKLVQSGVDLYTVMTLLGHSNISLTQRYAHLAPGATREAVALLDTPTDNVLAFPGTAKEQGA